MTTWYLHITASPEDAPIENLEMGWCKNQPILLCSDPDHWIDKEQDHEVEVLIKLRTFSKRSQVDQIVNRLHSILESAFAGVEVERTGVEPVVLLRSAGDQPPAMGGIGGVGSTQQTEWQEVHTDAQDSSASSLPRGNQGGVSQAVPGPDSVS